MSRPTVLFGAAVGGLLGAIALLVGLLYAAPRDIGGIWGIEPKGAQLYLESAGISAAVPSVTPATFRLGLRASLIAAWACWIALVAAAYRGPVISRHSGVLLVAAVGCVLALVGPPVLSTDALSYVAYGRVVYVHHLNPYQSGLGALQAAGDPAAALLFSPILMPYGPVWPLLMMAVGPIVLAMGSFAEVLVHKALAGAALVGMAVAGGRTADVRESGRGPLTVVAIGLNPLLLVEGPLGGHNDFIGAFFVMLAAMLSAGGSRAASLAVGLAVAIKATAVGVIPLLAYEHWVRSRPEARLSGLAWLLALTLLPVVALSLFFGGPLVLIDAVRARLDVARVTGPALWLARALLLSALVLGLWMIRSGPTGSWVTGWAVVALALVFASTTLRFPWFLVWALAPVLTAWDERHRILITLACACAFLLMWMYTIGP